MTYAPTENGPPFAHVGGEPGVRALVERFYDHMEAHEPAIARMHELDESGRVGRESRDRFALFLVGWLGGPQTYVERHGHPRLRMRHGRVRIDGEARDAWMRCMHAALDGAGLDADVRAFLGAKLRDLADFLRNAPG